jgi:hypothetical protein
MFELMELVLHQYTESWSNFTFTEMEVSKDDSSSRTTMAGVITMPDGSLLSRALHAHGNNGQLVLTLFTAGRVDEIFRTVNTEIGE